VFKENEQKHEHHSLPDISLAFKESGQKNEHDSLPKIVLAFKESEQKHQPLPQAKRSTHVVDCVNFRPVLDQQLAHPLAALHRGIVQGRVPLKVPAAWVVDLLFQEVLCDLEVELLDGPVQGQGALLCILQV
jgi:hypothetical protein